MVKHLFQFPDPVNETSARVVAAAVVLLGVGFLATGSGWLLLAIVYGFLARVATGPTLSPLGQVATRLVTPRLPAPHRMVPGPPKRFAQGIGLVVSGIAGATWLVGATPVSFVLIGGLVAAAGLESIAAVCLGCLVYNRIWDCEDCADLSEHFAGRNSEAHV